MTADCWTCSNAVYPDPRTAENFEGYSRGYGVERNGLVPVCEKWRVIRSQEFYKCGWSREPGVEG